MSDFLTRAACRGRRPQHLDVRRHVPRPHLIARLLRERHVARFVVAPDGFGKTRLALEYADTVFSFEHVFWIDGKSPCFLRDLDDGRIASTLGSADADPFLVVLEDVPPLDPDRVELLALEMDCVLDRGCEVLVTCVPTCDAFDCHRDRVKLSPVDLLLTDAEVDELRTPGERAQAPAPSLPPSRRVSGLAWGPVEERGSFLASILHEELPADLLLSLFVMLSLAEGPMEDVAAFCPHGADRVDILADRYPYLGIDRQRERFEAAFFAIEDIAKAFAARLELLAEQSLLPDRDTLVARMADVLAARREHERACDAVRLLASRPARAAWLASHGRELFDAACLVPACEAYRSLAGETAGAGARLDADEAARRALLGDRAGACAAARRVAGDAGAPPGDRTVGALVLAGCAQEDERRRAEALVTALASAAAARTAASRRRGAGEGAAAEGWAVAASVHVALSRSCADGAEAWIDWYDRGARGSALAHASSWVLRQAALSASPDAPQGAPTASVLERLAAIVRTRVSSAQGPMSLFEAMAGMSFERACERGAVALPGLDARAATTVRSMELALFAQRNACERIERERAERRRSFAATHPDSFRLEAEGARPAGGAGREPMLTVNLFGGFDVRIGEEPVDPTLFRRQKVKTLLALLVLNRGREFSRDKLVTLLWPESDLVAARKNFYGIWSMLRRALRTPSGGCPYLIRQQQGLRLDADLLASDVERLDGICRTLLFERPGYGGWAHLFAEVNDRFLDDLMPSESDNDVIASLRADYRSRLVDALVAASSRLVDAGDVQEGLWFARAAHQRDRTREDAYTALMRAQVAAGQRTAALDTYFSCRRFLADELGIDPSLETMALYREVIETEEVLE